MTFPTPFAMHVVIPAHNEAALIGRCLTSVRAAAAHLFDNTGVAATVVVVADSCTDSTVDVANQHGVDVLLLQARCVGRAATPAFDTCSQAQDRRTDRERGLR